ncbi:hypothetical protein G9A89_019399 [Geosiphon pyriformis]|nr:hypothetical protein G9A89_019399 [Geosiphon pyriformis]
METINQLLQSVSTSSNPLIRSFWLGKLFQNSNIFQKYQENEAEIKWIMSQWTSCLTPRVKELIIERNKEIHCTNHCMDPSLVDSILDPVTCLLSQNVFDEIWDNHEVIEPIPYDSMTTEVFKIAAGKIKRIADHVAAAFDTRMKSPDDFETIYGNELSWLGYKDIFKECFNLYREQHYLTSLLLAISSLEKLLGDILFTVGNGSIIIPPLLRELLIVPELVEQLSLAIMFFLRCLIGPPNSMNLRNILWHGFVSSVEISPDPAKAYCALLMIIAFTICDRVKNNYAQKNGKFRERPWADLEGYYFATQTDVNSITSFGESTRNFDVSYELVIYGHANIPQGEEVVVLQDLLPYSFFIISKSRAAWSRSFHHLLDKKPLLFLIDTLPLLEHCLRKLFICINKDVREDLLSTMELGQYFLTLDIILKRKILSAHFVIDSNEEKENALYDELGGGIMDLILDLFVHAAGPKLRNHIAHGEANNLVWASSDHFYKYYLGLLIVLWNKYKCPIPLIDNNDYFLGDPVKLPGNVMTREYEDWISQYKSRFHPIPILRKDCVKLITCIWECWKLASLTTQGGRFILGGLPELSDKLKFGESGDEQSIFEMDFLKGLLQAESKHRVMELCGQKQKSNTSTYWSKTKFSNEEAKVINFRRTVINKAIEGVQKIHSILDSVQTASSLSSRKRKNIQSLFSLLPLIVPQLLFGLRVLERTHNQKLMLTLLVFVERWCGNVVAGTWKDIEGAYNEMVGKYMAWK